MKITSPCKDCKDRYLGCHDKCCTYKSWKKEVEEIKAKEIEYTQLNNALFDLHTSSRKVAPIRRGYS